MPITGPSSYVPTVAAFITHWTAANLRLGAGKEIVLARGVTLAAFTAQRDALLAARDTVTDRGLDRALARETLNQLIAALQAQLVEFNERVRADLPGSPYSRVLPAAFALGDAEDSVREALRLQRSLWTKINAITPVPAGLELPLILRDGYAVAAHGTDMESLRLAYRALTEADLALRLAREIRNDLQESIYEVLKNYRQKLPTAVPAGDPLADSLPALTPAGGHTPEPVRVHGVWAPATERATITWDASKDTDLDHYELRAVAGSDYVSDDETVLATVEPDAAREFATDFALTQPGLTAGFKIFVVLKEGNERGSDPIFVTRPLQTP